MLHAHKVYRRRLQLRRVGNQSKSKIKRKVKGVWNIYYNLVENFNVQLIVDYCIYLKFHSIHMHYCITYLQIAKKKIWCSKFAATSHLNQSWIF